MTWFFIFPTVAASAVLNGLVSWIGLAIWSRNSCLHWSERARRLYPIQVTSVWGLFVTSICASTIARWMWGNSWDTTFLYFLAGFVGGLAGNYLPNRLYLHKLSAREYAGACFKTWVFFLGLIASAPLLSWAMGPEWNLRSASVAVLYLAAYVWFICTGWVWMMRRLGAIASAAPEVGALVREQAMARKILVKQVLFLEDFRALAFALPLQRSVLLTRKLVSLLSPEELRTVVDHELGHLGEPRGVLIGRIIGAMAFVPLPFLGVAADWHGIRGIAACYVAWMVIAFGSKRLARSMELRADHFAIESDQPGTAEIYASALEKIYSENLVPASGLARSQAHPDLYDRMLAAGIQPDFPRPAKPAYAHWTVLIWILLVFGLLSAKTLITGIAPQL